MKGGGKEGRETDERMGDSNLLSAHLSHVSYREAWSRDIKGMNEFEKERENVSIPEAMFPLAIYLSACTSASKSDISISQQWVPETLRHLFSIYPANQMQSDGGREAGRVKD